MPNSFSNAFAAMLTIAVFTIAQPLYAGLEGHWKFDETAGTTANDSSGNAKHGTLINMDPATDWGEIALDFDGVNDRVSTPVTVGTSFTWSAWFKMRTQSGYDSIITIPNTGGASDSSYMLMDVRGTRASFWANDNLRGQNLGIRNLQANVWYHMTFVREGNNINRGYKAYLNGALKGQRRTRTWSSSDTIDIGGRRGVSSQHFDGQIADVRVYDQALSAAEVANLYASSVRPGLVGRWKFDEGSGSTAADSSGRRHDSTIVNSPNWTTTCDGSAALEFDGIAEYATVADHTDLKFDNVGLGFVVAAWIQPSDLNSDGGIVGRWKSDTNRQWRLRVSAAEKRVEWSVEQSDGAVITAKSAEGVLNKDAWTHVVGLATGNTLTVFVNGVVSGTTPTYTTVAQPATAVNIEIGVTGRGGSETDYFHGAIRDVQIHNLALQESDIARLAGALAGHWKFDETSGETAADSSGAGNHAALVNGPFWATGNFQGGVEMDGQNDYVATDVTVGKTFTWSAWFKMNSQSGYDSIVTIPNSGGANDSSYMLMDIRGNRASFWANDGLGGQNLGVRNLQPNVWYHLAFVRRGDNISNGYTAYLNGVRKGSRRTRAWESSDKIWIGGRRGVSSQHFHGVIDDVRISLRALCDDEILDIFENETGAAGIRVLKWVEVK